MFKYNLYGLVIQANTPLKYLVEARDEQTVDIFITIHEQPIHFGELPFCRHKTQQISNLQSDLYHCLITGRNRRWFQIVSSRKEETTLYTISGDGKNIYATYNKNCDPRNVQSLLIHPILGFALRLQNIVCLHATAMIVDDHVIALLGEKGAGKSTTAAALYREGIDVFADDVTALSYNSQHFVVQPGLSQLRLLLDTAQFFYGTDKTFEYVLPGSAPGVKKIYLETKSASLSRKALPLAAIYFLEQRQSNIEKTQIKPLSKWESLSLLALNTSHRQILDKKELANEFQVLSRLANKVPVRKVQRRDDINKIFDVTNSIVEDVRFLLKEKQ